MCESRHLFGYQSMPIGCMAASGVMNGRWEEEVGVGLDAQMQSGRSTVESILQKFGGEFWVGQHRRRGTKSWRRAAADGPCREHSVISSVEHTRASFHDLPTDEVVESDF